MCLTVVVLLGSLRFVGLAIHIEGDGKPVFRFRGQAGERNEKLETGLIVARLGIIYNGFN